MVTVPFQPACCSLGSGCHPFSLVRSTCGAAVGAVAASEVGEAQGQYEDRCRAGASQGAGNVEQQ